MRQLLQERRLPINLKASRSSALQHCEGGDFDAVAREAHTIAGVAGNLGAVALTELARELERTSRAGDEANAARLAGDLGNAARAAAAEIRCWLDAQ